MQAPLPMGYARLEIDFGMVTLIGEGGYISIDVEDVEAKMLDLEAILELTALEPFSLFVGYRKIEFEGQGMVDGDNIDIDIGLSGLIVGGGVVF
jgi:hypothetical protein